MVSIKWHMSLISVFPIEKSTFLIDTTHFPNVVGIGIKHTSTALR